MFPSKSIHTDGIRAGIMSSLGFGQVGGIAVVNPRYLFATLEPCYYETYRQRHALRALQSYKSMSEMMIKNSLVKIKETPPYSPELEAPVLLNSLARASLDIKTGSYKYAVPLALAVPMDTANVAAFSESLNAPTSVVGVGVNQELISAVPSSNRLVASHCMKSHTVAYSSPAIRCNRCTISRFRGVRLKKYATVYYPGNYIF
ncbi:hypothetical protein B0H12DRAFT_233880 [Mycena haematopus]|nr:hypothetical protein B0H12DRAFT_233880 [Mycena haematopus]